MTTEPGAARVGDVALRYLCPLDGPSSEAESAALFDLEALRAALTQSAAEVAELKGDLADADACGKALYSAAMERAEKAERERDEARDALRECKAWGAVSANREALDVVSASAPSADSPDASTVSLADKLIATERRVAALREALAEMLSGAPTDSDGFILAGYWQGHTSALMAAKALAASSPDHAGAPEGE